MKKPPQDHSRYFLQSLAKGLSVLLALAEANHPLNLTEIATEVGTNHATATRCCYTLGEMGLIWRDRNRRYHITPKILSLGYAAVSSLGWRKVAQHYLEILAGDSGETVNLSMLDQGEILYISRINTGSILPYELQLGSKLPVYCTSMGKALMAFSPDEAVNAILDKIEYVPLTHRTISCREEFAAELQKVKARGFAVNDEELSVGLRSIAAPILNNENTALAAINMAVPTKRISLGNLIDRLAPKLTRTAKQISVAIRAMDI